MDLYVKVRRAVMVENKSERAVARYFGIHRNTVRKMCQFAAPPGYRPTPAPVSPTLAPFVAIIDAILEADKQVHVKQRHTAVRMLLVDHFKAIKLPTFAREYEKVGADCAGDAEPEQIPGAGVGTL